jgi:hypothetical protein
VRKKEKKKKLKVKRSHNVLEILPAPTMRGKITTW